MTWVPSLQKEGHFKMFEGKCQGFANFFHNAAHEKETTFLLVNSWWNMLYKFNLNIIYVMYFVSSPSVQDALGNVQCACGQYHHSTGISCLYNCVR